MSDYAKRILEAYCNEAQEIVNIEQASEIYAKLGEKLSFSCSDENCRQLVVGVNYTEEITIRSAHFRRHNKHIHSPNCIWGNYEKVLEEMLVNKHKYVSNGGNLFKDFETADASSVFDIFLPTKRLAKEQSELQRLTRSNTHSYILNHRKSTSKLQFLVEIYDEMSEQDRKKAKLKINGQSLSYNNIFKPIEFIEERHTYPHIYFGEAKIYKYGDGSYTVFFQNNARQYKDENRNLKVTIFIPKHLADPPLYEKLNLYSASKKEITCYIFGQDRHTLCTEKALNYKEHCRDKYDEKLPCVTFCNYSRDHLAFLLH